MADLSFPQGEHLKSRADFSGPMQKGWSFNHNLCKVFYCKGKERYSRLGLIVGKKVGHAPTRNLWKRHLKEAFRLERVSFPAPYDVVVLIKGKSESLGVQDLRSMFRSKFGDEGLER